MIRTAATQWVACVGYDMFLVPIDQIEQLLTRVHAALPREASGLLLRREVKRFTVLSFAGTSTTENTPFSFRIRDAAIDKIEKSLSGSSTSICGCFHSHVLGAARPSKLDCTATKKPGDLWFIYSVRFRHLHLFAWNGITFQKERFLITPALDTPTSTRDGG
jgi:proteasome lid subunit RPN8/RPN11